MSALTVWTADEVGELVAAPPPVGLERLDEMAALQTRRDRKYVLTPDQATDALGSVIDRMAALEIDGRRTFTYRSLYFDTADRRSYRAAATARRRRFKVRQRRYVDAGTAVLEVKTRGGRGETVKQRIPYGWDVDRLLTVEGRAFVDEVVGAVGLGDLLRPVVWTAYERSTLVDLVDQSRVTVDAQLGSSVDGERWRGLTGAVIVETKASDAATPLDRALWAIGCRPVSISKFGVAMAIEDPSLPAARWRRTMRRHFVRPVALAA
jgi:VTC domain